MNCVCSRVTEIHRTIVNAYFNLQECDLLPSYMPEMLMTGISIVTSQGIEITLENVFNLLLNDMWIVKVAYSFSL